MSITLIAVRNPQWKTVKQPKLDADGNPVMESDGETYVSEVVNDADGNPVKVINCECQWSHLGDDTQEWFPFTASPDDIEQHGKDLYNAIVAGDHGAIADE